MDHPSGPADSVPQEPAPAAPTSQTGGPPQAPPVNNQNKNHQDPPEVQWNHQWIHQSTCRWQRPRSC